MGCRPPQECSEMLRFTRLIADIRRMGKLRVQVGVPYFDQERVAEVGQGLQLVDRRRDAIPIVMHRNSLAFGYIVQEGSPGIPVGNSLLKNYFTGPVVV